MDTQEKKEIIWNIVNSLLAGLLVFLGAISSEVTDHGLTGDAIPELTRGAVFGLITAAVIAATKFKDYWAAEEIEYKLNKSKTGAFNFL